MTANDLNDKYMADEECSTLIAAVTMAGMRKHKCGAVYGEQSGEMRADDDNKETDIESSDKININETNIHTLLYDSSDDEFYPGGKNWVKPQCIVHNADDLFSDDENEANDKDDISKGKI